jgi:DNA-binding Lrp family transcriptional regulator
MAVHAYVLVTVEGGAITDALDRLRDLPAVTGAQAVSGPYNLIAQVEAESMSALGQAVLAQIRGLPGVARTVTCVVKGNR